MSLSSSDRASQKRVSSIDAVQLARTPVAADSQLLAAALTCIERWGVAKTTLDDVARVAGVSRATLYRHFPGGKDSLIAALGHFEMAKFFAAMAVHLGPEQDLAEVLTEALFFTHGYTRDHAALQYLTTHEPGFVFAGLAFGRLQDLLDRAADSMGSWLEPYVGAVEAPRAVEWVVRVALSYLISPSPWVHLDDRDSVRELVRTFLIPGLRRVANGATLTVDPANKTDLPAGGLS